MKLNKLKEPFHPSDIEWRIKSSGIKNGKPWGLVLAYVTNRAIMDRLDEVCGQENWKNEYKPGVDGGVICILSIRINNEWITKEDGAPNTDKESVKGGLSGAMKRAGVQWGVGRYLYNLDSGFAEFKESGKYNAKVKKDKNDPGQWFKWNPPQLPKWALPSGTNPENIDFEKLIDYGKELKGISTETYTEYRALYKQEQYKECETLYNKTIGVE